VGVDNISWCDLGDGAAVIDALEDASQADVVRNLIRETTGRELKWIVNTHWDVDHIACNPQWRAEGAILIAHESSAASAGDWAGRPDIAYSAKAALQGQGEKRIEMEWVGGTHTPWDCFLYFPHARVLHIADLFGWGLIPCRPTPQKIARLKEVLGKILGYEANAVICGHGPVTSLENLRIFLRYLDEMLEKVPPLAQAGQLVEEIEKQLPPPAEMRDWWRFTDWKHAKNIEMIAEDWKP